MKKIAFFAACLYLLLATSCATLTSNTRIEPNKSFVLGENNHPAYSVKLRNKINKNLTVTLIGADGKLQKTIIAKPDVWVTVDVPENTALRVNNETPNEANVDLKVFGTTNLSMGYKG